MFNPLRWLGLCRTREEEKPNGEDKQSTRSTLLTASEQEIMDKACKDTDEEAARKCREQREQAQAELLSSTVNLHEAVDELNAQQVRETGAQEKNGQSPMVQGSGENG